LISTPIFRQSSRQKKKKKKNHAGDFEPPTFLEPEPNRPLDGLPYLHASGWAVTEGEVGAREVTDPAGVESNVREQDAVKKCRSR
jgi:hypothetical protein